METNSSGEENQAGTLVMSSSSSQLFTDLSLLTTALIVPYADDGATGTGLINSFVMIQDSPEEEGYNSDYRGTGGDNTQFDETNTLQFNHAITLASIPVVTKDGQQYLVLHLDLNEPNAGTGPLIDLQTLKIFASGSPYLTGYDDDANGFLSGESMLLYDMDSGGDVTVRLDESRSGSGKGDYTFYIPVDGINDLPGFTNTSSGAFIYVYSKFGDPDRDADGTSDGGFEEWFVMRQAGAHIDLAKTATIIGDTDTPDAIDNANESIRYVITITNTGSVDLTQLAVDDTMGGTWQLNQALLADTTDALYIAQSGEGNHGDDILAPGEVWQITYIYDVTEDDLLSDQILNTATITTEQGAGDDATATVDVVAPPPMPAIVLTKMTGDGFGLDGDAIEVLAGSAIVWNYVVTNTGNTDLRVDKTFGLVDDNGTADLSDDFNPVYLVFREVDLDGVLSVGESWFFEFHGKAVYGAYANTATVTAYFGDVPVTASDDSSYFGTFEQAMAGRTQGFWGSRPGIWDGSTANNASFEKLVGTVLSAAEINPGQGYVLVGDLNGDGLTSAGENTISVSNDVARALLSAKVSGDARISMLQQAIAAQLDIYNGVVNPGDATGSGDSGYQSLAGDLITEATLWLKTWGGGTKSGSASNLFADGVIDTNDYNISKASLADTQSAAQRTLFWNTAVDVDSTARDIHATGEDLKNLLDAFNNNKLITSAEGQVAWNQNDVSPETIVEPTGVEMNVADAFWAVGHDYISDFKGLVWHG